MTMKGATIVRQTQQGREVWPVMLTPFQDDRSIDWHALDALVEWYIDSGAAGLFAVCLSSEMYHLDDEERLALVRHVVQRCRGRVPIVASGTFGGQVKEQAASVQRMAGTGVEAVVVITSQLAAAAEPDELWRKRAQELLDLTGKTRMGLYECPVPYKRLLSRELLQLLVATGRFSFFKDTSCDSGRLAERSRAIAGTRLRLYNAHTPTLLASLRAGCHGFSGIGANFYPSLYVWLCRHAETHPQEAAELQRFLTDADIVIARGYPLSAKVFLSGLGLPIKPICREQYGGLSAEEQRVLRDLAGRVSSVAAGLPKC